MKRLWSLALIALIGCSALPDAQPAIAPVAPSAWPYSLQPEVATAPRAMVVTDAPVATEVGVRILRDGGNAMDAAVATAFALAVVYPEAGNIGGGGFMVARFGRDRSFALDFREKAPLGSTRDMYLDAQGNVTDRSLIGHQASGVPGAVMGLWEAHRELGSRPWAELLEPAIQLARDGFIVDSALARSIVNAESRLRRFEGSTALFFPNGQPLRAGSRWRNPDLARVLQRIADRGPPGFYEGETADLIVAEMKRGGGIITHEDLRRYRAEWRRPLQVPYRGHILLAMPPASSGGITLNIMAQILAGYPLRELGWHSAESLHLTAEAMRRAFADRNHFLGDPAFVQIPTGLLLSSEYAARQRQTISRTRATPSAEVRPGLGAASEPEHTTHFSIVDANGNAVALTTTINELYGSAVTVSGGGFLLNDEMDDFTSKPGTPNMFGLVQGEANAIQPEKRMLSAMTPTIVLDRSGNVLMVTGARGGPRIITAVFQVISNVLDYGMDVGAAVNAPRIHHQHLPDVLGYEREGLPADVIAQLQAMGHTVEARAGVGTAPTILRRGGLWTAVPDPRTGGLARGY